MNLPEEFDINRAELVDNHAYTDSDSRSLLYRQRKQIGQRWEFELTSNVLEPRDLKKVMAFVGGIKRDNGNVTVALPIYSESNAGTVNTTSAVSLGGSQVSCAVTGIEVGDFFKFSNNQKCYQVTNVDAGSIRFTPGAVVESPSGTQITFDGVEFTLKITNRPQVYRVTASNDSASVGLEMLEVF